MKSFWEIEERLNYLHENPVRSGLVCVRRGEWYYNHSSAIDYTTNEKGLLEISHLVE